MSKKILAMLLCLCMVVCMIPLSAGAEEVEAPKVYVALGDSIPAGYGVDEGKAYPELLAETCGYTLQNLSESGAVSADLTETIQENLTAIASADIITITVGGNDLMDDLYDYVANAYNAANSPEVPFTKEIIQQKLAEGDSTVFMAVLPYLAAYTKSENVKAVIENFSNKLVGAIAAIKAVNADVAIVVTTQYNPYTYLAKALENNPLYADYATLLATGFEAGVTALNTVISTLPALTQACTVADVYSVFAAAEENPCNAGFTSETTYTLDFHPNAYGQSLYAQVLDETINPLPFTDVDKDQWYYDAVRYAYFNDLMTGTGNNQFQPTTVLDRATVVQILYNLEGQPEVEELTDKFNDVGTQWYAKAITWAVENGVVAGNGDGTFGPNTAISREGLAQMLYNYALHKKYNVENEGDLSSFTDADKVSEWAETALTWANANELINGNGDGTITPTAGAQRAHAASILMKFCENVVAAQAAE